MSVFRKLAGETALYGLSSILARVVNFILVPIHTAVFTNRGDYGVIGQLYGWIAAAVVLYSFRLEAAYFRYTSHDSSSKSYSNGKIFTLVISLVFSACILIFAKPIANWLQIEGFDYLIKYAALIISIDALCELPFARLRLQKRPIKFVTIKVISILANVFFNGYFLLLGPKFNLPVPGDKIAAVFIANLIASVITLLLLNKEYLAQGFTANKEEIKKILTYAWPLLIVGLAAVMNDAMTRQFLGWFATGNAEEKKILMGEYNACVKFGVFIALFVQAFRYAAEPFFFAHMHSKDAKSDYSKITTYFTQFTMIGFVSIMLYLDFIKNIVVRNPAYLHAIAIVPIVLMANVFLGIYYNVSNWYRLTDKTRFGMYSALIGVGLTLFFNIVLVPRYGYIGTAWAMFICYFGMTLVTYLWGQKYYPVNFELKKIFTAILGGLVIYLLNHYLRSQIQFTLPVLFLVNSLFLIIYLVGFNYPILKIFLKR
ncbi:MAG: polysaccharide biosynthesis C-terminal domain-containing protein [Saprospiraceae bacterium]